MDKKLENEENGLKDKKDEIIIQQQKNITRIKIAEFVCAASLLFIIFVSLCFVVAVQILSKNESYKKSRGNL